MNKLNPRYKARQPRSSWRPRLEAWAVGATFLVLITVTVAQSLSFGF